MLDSHPPSNGLSAGAAMAYSTTVSEPVVKRQTTIDPSSLKLAIASVVGPELRQVQRVIADSLSTSYQSIQYLANLASKYSGKQLRPVLVFLTAKAVEKSTAFDNRTQNDLRNIAAAVEMVHLASLVHDDVMDGAETRRHQPTIFNAAGASSAILLGDFLFTRAYAAAAGCSNTFPARSIAKAATKLCVGELRQQISSTNWKLSLAEYYSIIDQKTASLCAISCRLGAWRSGASREQQLALYRFGRNLGLAFQIFDDWLDYWGTSATGKTLGTDLLQLKPTLPLMAFLKRASARDRVQLQACLDTPSPENLELARRLIQNSSAAQVTIEMAHRFASRSIEQLEILDDSPARQLLEQLAQFSVQRES